MPGLDWWALHAAQSAAIALLLGLSLRGAWRIGAHTLYGNLLFLLAMGFWALLLGEALFVGRQAIGAYEGPGGFNDVLNVVGWLLLASSIILFVTRFMPRGEPILAWILLPAVGAVFVLRFWLSPPGQDPDAWLRATYLFTDAGALGAVAAGYRVFRRLRQAALGRLYLFLGIAILLRTAGDVYWAYLAARGQTSLVATAFYPSAALVAVVGLGLHDRHMQKEAIAPMLTVPWLNQQQRQILLLGAKLQDAAGGYAARTALAAAAQELDRHGFAWRLQGFTLDAKASPEAWQQAVQAAEGVALHLLGSTGNAAVQSAREAA